MLRNWLDKVEPLFLQGGRLSKLYPLYEAADTFLYTPASVTRTASHVRDGIDLKRMMVLVVIALGPCFFMALNDVEMLLPDFLGHLDRKRQGPKKGI